MTVRTREFNKLGQQLENEEAGSRLRPGIANSELARISEELAPLDLPEQLRSFYLWHDGMEDSLDIDFCPFGFEWLPMDSAIRLRRDLKPHLPSNFLKFLPIGNADGAIVLASLSNVDSKVCQLFCYFSEEGEVCLIYSDIPSLLRAVSEWYEERDNSPQVLRLKYSPSAWSFDQVGATAKNGVDNVFDLDTGQFDRIVGEAILD